MISAPKTWEYTLGARRAHASVRLDLAKAATLLIVRRNYVSHSTKNLHRNKNICFVALLFIYLDNYTRMYVIIKLY
jgi:hypothetical protein